jgi:hypothetical protein
LLGTAYHLIYGLRLDLEGALRPLRHLQTLTCCMLTLQECNILKHFPWHSYSFQLLTVEHNYIEPQRSYIRELLESHGYVFQQEKFVHDWWAQCFAINQVHRRLQDFVLASSWASWSRAC